jgi:hypothetical protein
VAREKAPGGGAAGGLKNSIMGPASRMSFGEREEPVPEVVYPAGGSPRYGCRAIEWRAMSIRRRIHTSRRCWTWSRNLCLLFTRSALSALTFDRPDRWGARLTGRF